MSATWAGTSTPAYNLNQAVPGSGAVNNRRPFFAVRPALADVTWAVSDGMAAYHAFQFSAQKRLTHGLTGLLSYTWGHSIDTVGQSFGGGADGPLPQDPRNRWADRGNSPFDIRHRLTIAWNYVLPFGKGRKWLNGGGPAEYVLGGWQINGINTFQTGLPFTPTLNAATVNTGTGSRPDRIGDGKLSDPTVDRWFDVTAFATPAPFTYGNSGRNILYGPGRVELRLLALQGLPHRPGRQAAVPHRVLQLLQHAAVRSAECRDRRRQRRNDHQHRRHAAPDSVRGEGAVLIQRRFFRRRCVERFVATACRRKRSV